MCVIGRFQDIWLNRSALLRFTVALLGIFFITLIFRWSALQVAFPLNEDAGLIVESKKFIEENGVWYPFISNYGPRVFRPLMPLTLYLEHHRLQLSLRESLLVGFVLYSGALLLLGYSLARWLTVAGVTATGKPIGICVALGFLLFTPLSGDALFWLSDRHDLYLLWAFVLAFFFLTHPSSAFAVWLLALSGSFLLGFFSNEKSVAIPIIIAVLGTPYLLFHGTTASRAKVAIIGLWATGFVTTLAFLFYREWVLGPVQTGYPDHPFLDESFTLLRMSEWLTGIFGVFFRAVRSTDATFQRNLIGGVFVALIFIGGRELVRRKRDLALSRKVLFLAASLLALLIAGIPTFRYILMTTNFGAVSLRYFWLPTILAALFLAILFGTLAATTSRVQVRLVATLAMLLLGCTVREGFQIVRDYRFAYRMSRAAVDLHQEVFPCADLGRAQTAIQPKLLRGLPFFTESIWLEYAALYRGSSVCRQSTSAPPRQMILRRDRNNVSRWVLKDAATENSTTS